MNQMIIYESPLKFVFIMIDINSEVDRAISDIRFLIDTLNEAGDNLMLIENSSAYPLYLFIIIWLLCDSLIA